MSDITANIVVQPFNLGVTIEQPTLTVQPEAINLSVYAGGFAQAAGNNGTVQYNNGGVLGGIPSVFWTGTKLSLGDTNNITISGGSPNYALRTDGAGNLSWGDTANANYANFAGNALYADNSGNANIANIANVAYSVSAANVVGTVANANYAAYAGNVTIAAQPNITSLGNLTSLRVVGTSNLGNVGNVKITGGTNGQYMQTDGTGNLFFVTGGGSGNGVVGGTDTQVQFNDGGLFGGNAGFVFNKTTGNLTVGGSLTVGGTYVGNASGLTSVPGANVTGAVANATYAANAGFATSATSATTANTAGTVTTAAQPNITTVGTLNSLFVSGVTSVYETVEDVALIGAQSGTYTFNVTSGAIQYSTANASANVTLNFTGVNSTLGNGKSLTATYLLTNGATSYQVSGIQIEGTTQSIKWVFGVLPNKYINSIQSYTFTIIKTSTTPTYTVLGSMTRYA